MVSDDIPVGQWECICGGSDKRTNEKIPHCTGSFNDLPFINELINGETEQLKCEYA